MKLVIVTTLGATSLLGCSELAHIVGMPSIAATKQVSNVNYPGHQNPYLK